MKTIIQKIIFILIFANVISAQSNVNFSEAMELYNASHFAEARERFLDISMKHDIDENLVVSSKYYAADCLLKLGLLNGTIHEFEYFVSKYNFSNFRVEALFKLGTTYFELEDYQKVREKLLILISEYPKYEKIGLAYYWIGQSYANENKYIEAEEFLLEAVSRDRYGDKIDYTIYSLAYIYELQEKYSNAVTYYDELLAYHPESELLPSAQLRIGGSYFKLKEYERAVLELTDPLILELPEKEQIDAGYLLANSYFRLGEYEKAENAFRDVLKRNTSGNIERELKFGVAWVNFQQQNYGKAYEQFLELTLKGEQDSISIKSLYWSGESKRYLGETAFAEKIYETFLTDLESNSYTDAVRLSLGIIQYNRKEFKEASTNLIISSYSNNKNYKSRALILLGEINLEYQNYREAELYFDKAVKIPMLPQDVSNRAILGLGAAQYYLKKYDDASMNLIDLSVRARDFEKRKTHYYLAETYFAMGNFRKAQQHFYRVDLGDDYIGKSALYGMAYSYFNLKDYGNSAYYFKEYITKYKNYGNFIDAQLRLADSYFGMKNFDLASAEYEKYFSKYPDRSGNDFVLFQYGQSLFKSGKSNSAINKFKLLLKRFPNSKYCDDSQYLIGWIHFQKNNYDLAINNYKNLITEYPKSSIVPIAYYSIGDSYYNSEEYDSSIVYYLKIIDNFPKTQFVYDAMNGIQYSYLALDRPDDAVSLINGYIVKYPHIENSDRILMKKGEIYFSYGNYGKAMIGYSEMINFYPNSELVPEALYWMGKSSLQLKKPTEAADYFKEIIDKHIISDYGIEAIVELGKIYSGNKNYLKEIELYKSVLPKIAASPKAEEILFLQGAANINADKKDDAYKSFNEIITYYDKTLFSDKAKIEIGILEIENKRASNSEQLFSEVAENRNDDIGAKAQYYLGVARYEQKKYDGAISALVRVRTVFATYDEWFTKSLLKLGDSYHKLNDKANARKMYKAVIKKHPRNEYGKEARRKLKKV
ncbi:MAG: tetratricopeptide repeat protein [Melioribacteraceae bacterium]|nr:tetratricopeptide repeat protein [Melioribacteraceae bacterium]